MGALAPRLPAKEAEALLLRRAQALCQDMDYAVRQAMVAQLPALARAGGRLAPASPLATAVLNALLEALQDDEVRSKSKALES